MNIGITGATGFIGNELVLRHMALGNSVRIFTYDNIMPVNLNGQIQVFNGDLSIESDSLNDFVKDLDILYHCAAEIRNESKMYMINVTGTQNLVNAAGGRIKHWVQLSSTGVYGSHKISIISEDTPLNPKNEYEITKLKSDEIIKKAGLEKKFDYTIIRPSNVFGCSMKNQSLFQLIRIIDKGLFFFIGKKGASANYVSVENVVNALVLCGLNEIAYGKIYILSDWLTIERFVGIIAKELNIPFPGIRLPKLLVKSISSIGYVIPFNPLTVSRVEALTNRSKYSNELISRELKYEHCIEIEESLVKLVQSYKTQFKNSN